MNKIIHFCTGPQPTPLQQHCINTARSLCPTWEVRVWQDPIETSTFRLHSYISKANSGAQLADLIRLDVVYQHGGIYLDSDIVLHRNLDPLANLDNFFCSEDGEYLTNAAFGASKHSPIVDTLITHLLDNEPDWTRPPNVTTGPRFFTRVIGHNKAIVVVPRDSFFPYDWNEPPRSPEPTSFGTHLWNHSWVPKRTRLYHRLRRTATPVKAALKVCGPNLDRSLRQLCRTLTYPGHSTNGEIVIRTNRRIYMVLPASDLSVVPSLAFKATYEEPYLRFIERILKGGDVFVDVGCNVGTYSLVASTCVKRFGQVHAFDPNTQLLSCLQRSLRMNWLHNIHTSETAVGQRDGTTQIAVNPSALGDTTRIEGRSTTEITEQHPGLGHTPDLTTATVPMVSLDSYFPLSTEIKCLKIDVEGFEPEVLFGSRRLLSEQAFKYIILEDAHDIGSRDRTAKREATELLMDSGYVPGRISKNGRFLSDQRQSGRNKVYRRR